MHFVEKQQVLLKGLINSKLVEVGGMPKPNGGNNKGFLLQLMETDPSTTTVLLPLQKLLNKFTHMLEESHDLPPNRIQNHANHYYLGLNLSQCPHTDIPIIKRMR